jgi:hypothetical protein
MIDDLYDDMPAPLLSIEKEPDGTRVLEVDTYTATARARGDWHAEEHAHPGATCRIALRKGDRAEWHAAWTFARWLLRVARQGYPMAPQSTGDRP